MFKVIVRKGMLMATWKHEMSILMSEQTQKVKKLFRKKKKIVSSRDYQIFSSLHTQRGHFICSRTCLFSRLCGSFVRREKD